MKVFGSVNRLSPLLVLLAGYPCSALNALKLNDLSRMLMLQPIQGQEIKAFEAFRSVPGASDFAAGVLCERKMARQWSNAVFALGAIGDQTAKAALETFLRAASDPLSGTRRLSPTMFDAKVDSLFALGYMAVHSPDPAVRSDAKLFLDKVSGLTSTFWREIEWDSPYHATRQARDAYLVGKVRLVMTAVRKQTQPPPVADSASAVLAHNNK